VRIFVDTMDDRNQKRNIHVKHGWLSVDRESHAIQ
jgi:hypothetical protein